MDNGQVLDEMIAFIILAAVEDLVDYPLRKAFIRADGGGRGFDAAALAGISKIWQEYFSFNDLCDHLMCLVRTPHNFESR